MECRIKIETTNKAHLKRIIIIQVRLGINQTHPKNNSQVQSKVVQNQAHPKVSLSQTKKSTNYLIMIKQFMQGPLFSLQNFIEIN